MAKQKIIDDIIKQIHREELAELTKALVDIPSPTGSEKSIGEFILNWHERHGIRPVRQELGPERVNAIGLVSDNCQNTKI